MDVEESISLGSSGNTIQVVLRKRPIIEGKEDGENDIVRCGASTNVTVFEPKIRLDLTPVIEPSSFEFDYVFDENATNAQIYRECCQPLLENVRQGGGAVVFAFGQTGSGKTFSMLGRGQTPGLYGLAVTDLLSMAKGNNSLTASFFEVYGTKLYDLLNDRAELRLLQDEYKNIHVVGLTHTQVKSAEDVKSLMLSGQTLRAIGTTHANDRSSRSHAVLEITLHLPDEESDGRITFVDLAGSERATDTAEMDAKTRREGAEINKSLLALKECIRSMSMRKRHIPFRASKLTQILRESFVGRCKTVVIATISPCQRHCEDTLNTLRYAHRIKELKISNPNIADAPMPCAHCGLPIFVGDRHVCRRMQIQCPHCRQEMEKTDLEAHMLECKEVPLRCPYCNERMLRGEQGKHNRRCTKLPVRCQACNQQMPRHQLEKHMLSDCSATKEKCRYCRMAFPRALLNSHEQNCDAMMKACEHCLQFIRKSRMEVHLQQCPMNPNRGKPSRRPIGGGGGGNANLTTAQGSTSLNSTPKASPNRIRSALSPRRGEASGLSPTRQLPSPGSSAPRQERKSSAGGAGGRPPATSSNTTTGGPYVSRDANSGGGGGGGVASSANTGPSGAANTSTSSASATTGIPCPYSRYGCHTKVSQRNLASHLEDSIREHLELVTKYADKIDLQNAELRRLVVSGNPLPPLPPLRRLPGTEKKSPARVSHTSGVLTPLPSSTS